MGQNCIKENTIVQCASVQFASSLSFSLTIFHQEDIFLICIKFAVPALCPPSHESDDDDDADDHRYHNVDDDDNHHAQLSWWRGC